MQAIEASRRAKITAIIRVASGNFLEMYDFMVFGYYAAAIGKAFFPRSNPFASLMMSLATFAVGFLMRPLGALVLGAYIDRRGRRAGLMLTLALMCIGTLSIACVPDYRVIGILAPVLVLAGRLLQGFSAGVELGGVSVYLAEIATPRHKGFYVSWQSASQQFAVIFAAVLGVALSSSLSEQQMTQWGWRVPLLIGCLIIPLLFILRRSLAETEEFLARKRPTRSEIVDSLAANWELVILGMMLVTMTTVSFYMITAYTPTFGQAVLHLANRDNLIVTLCVGLSNLFWLPVMGAVSDRIGRRVLLLSCTALALLTAYPSLAWLVSDPSFARLLAVELWLSFVYGSYNAAMVVYLTEIMPAQVRASGFSVAYSLATAIFGGSTPAICTYLIHATGNKAIPGLWLCFAAASGLTAVLILGRITNRSLYGGLHNGLSPVPYREWSLRPIKRRGAPLNEKQRRNCGGMGVGPADQSPAGRVRQESTGHKFGCTSTDGDPACNSTTAAGHESAKPTRQCDSRADTGCTNRHRNVRPGSATSATVRAGSATSTVRASDSLSTRLPTGSSATSRDLLYSARHLASSAP
ncbi:MAG: MFS transporter [Acidobacteriaceae bacterium]|nr:MFS transporter [Acidobacteriaceae bacterium]